MSAFLVSNATVNAIATFAADQGVCEDPAAAALHLWQANRAALRHHYADADAKWPELAALEDRFRYDRQPIESRATLRALLQSYAYQAAQGPDWTTSEAARILDRLLSRAGWDAPPQNDEAR